MSSAFAVQLSVAVITIYQWILLSPPILCCFCIPCALIGLWGRGKSSGNRLSVIICDLFWCTIGWCLQSFWDVNPRFSVTTKGVQVASSFLYFVYLLHPFGFPTCLLPVYSNLVFSRLLIHNLMLCCVARSLSTYFLRFLFTAPNFTFLCADWVYNKQHFKMSLTSCPCGRCLQRAMEAQCCFLTCMCELRTIDCRRLRL